MSDLDDAFSRAADARQAIAGVIDAVRAGELDLEAAFAQGDAELLVGRCFAVKVFEVVPDIGKVRARRTMEAVGLTEDIWLAQVPTDKRVEVIAALAASDAEV